MMTLWEKFRKGLVAIDLTKEKGLEPIFGFMSKKQLTWLSGREIHVTVDSNWCRTIDREFTPYTVKGEILCCESAGIAIGLRKSYENKFITFKQLLEEEGKPVQLKLFDKPTLRIARSGRDGGCRGCENLLWDAETNNDIKMLTAYCMISEDVFYEGDAKLYDDKSIKSNRCPLSECNVVYVQSGYGNYKTRIFENKRLWAEYRGKNRERFTAYMQLKK